MRIFLFAVLILFPVLSFAQSCHERPGLDTRDRFSHGEFPAVEAAPGTVAESCVTFTNLTSPLTVRVQRDRFDLSVDGGAWADQVTVDNGQELRIRGTAPAAGETDRTAVFDSTNRAGGGWDLIGANDARAPQTFRVGPGRTYTQLTQVAPLVSAGDVIEVDAGTYDAFELTKAGVPGNPVTIRGIGDVTIQGDLATSSYGDRLWPWTISLRRANHLVIENVTITGGGTICVRNAANDVTFRNVVMRDCPGHGFLGIDIGGGALTIVDSEIYNVGNSDTNASIRHPVYIGTDPLMYPGATLRVENTTIRDFRGNAIKSRAERSEIVNNTVIQSDWVNPSDSRDHAFYNLELIGPDGRPTIRPMQSVVEGNTFIHDYVGGNLYGIRIGGDGTGYSDGDVVFRNNEFVLPVEVQTATTPYIRLFHRLRSVELIDNVFRFEDNADRAFAIFRDDIQDWYDGAPLVSGSGNQLPASYRLERINQFDGPIRAAWEANHGGSPVPDPDPQPDPDPVPDPDPDPTPDPDPDPVPATRVDITGRGGAYYEVYVDGVKFSQHTTQSNAFESAVNQELANPSAETQVRLNAIWDVEAR